MVKVQYGKHNGHCLLFSNIDAFNRKLTFCWLPVCIIMYALQLMITIPLTFTMAKRAKQPRLCTNGYNLVIFILLISIIALFSLGYWKVCQSQTYATKCVREVFHRVDFHSFTPKYIDAFGIIQDYDIILGLLIGQLLSFLLGLVINIVRNKDLRNTTEDTNIA